MEDQWYAQIGSVIMNCVFSIAGSVLTLALGVWACIAYYSLHGQTSNTIHCKVVTIKTLLLTDGLLNFVSMIMILLGTCTYALEQKLMPYDENGKRRTPFSSLCTSYRGCIACASLIIIIVLTVSLFGGNCETEAPVVFNMVKPYVIANYVLMAVSLCLAACMCCLIVCISIGATGFVLLKN